MEKWFEIRADIATSSDVTKSEIVRSLREFFESKKWDWNDGFVKEIDLEQFDSEVEPWDEIIDK